MSSLTRTEAARRAELLTVHSYHVDLDLSRAVSDDGFASATTIRFASRGPSSFLDLKAAAIERVRLNGVDVDLSGFDGDRIPLTDLTAENELVVWATMRYSNTGEGMHRFVDPEDGETYLYAQSFLDNAPRVFACFDQPDLKATLTLSVTAPAGWIVAANALGECAVDRARADLVRWEFGETAPLSTYLMALIAGPYHHRTETHDGIPLSLYCRRSLARFLDADVAELFTVTASCLDRYHELFDVRYPFGGYGQAFVPEFNEGAMENPGIVTLRDEFLFRSTATDDQREQRAMTIAHELAHMWFGDLVTMRWWDDLWLNESFAEYLGHRVVAEATRFTTVWTGFAVSRKAWGYAADQRPTTHPVAPSDVDDADSALMNFDGISYAKGASVIRQLAAWIGDDAFLAGLREHIATHAFGNATLDDLLASLGRARGRDLSAWARVWLRSTQVNTLRPEVSIGPDGRYSAVEIVQTAPGLRPTLRPHRIDVGVYHAGALSRRAVVDLDPVRDGRRTPVPELVGSAPGDLLLVNDGDLTYAKIRFDDRSRADLPRALADLSDPLARALVWGSLIDSTRDAETRPSDFVALCAAVAPSEQHLTIFRDVMRFATGVVIDCYLPTPARPTARGALVGACRAVLDVAKPGSGRQLAAARALIAAADVTEVEALTGWLRGADVPEGLAVDAELRWAIWSRLATLGAAEVDEIDKEYARDRTASGMEHAVRARAARPEAAAKATAWKMITEGGAGVSARQAEAAAAGLWQPDQDGFTSSYVDRYFTQMSEVASRRSPGIAAALAAAAYPRFAVRPQTWQAADDLLSRDDVSPALRRVVTDLTDDLRRAHAARTLEGS